MASRWLHSVDQDPSRPLGSAVTIRELIDRFGEFYVENDQHLLTRRGVIRVARQVRRARRNGTLSLPGDPPNQPPPAVA